MITATIYILRNTYDGRFISNDKIALWAQTSKLEDAHFFPKEHNAEVNAKRLNGYVAKYRKQKAAGEHVGWDGHLNDNFEAVPVVVQLLPAHLMRA